MVTANTKSSLSDVEQRQIADALNYYEERRHHFEKAAKNMLTCLEDDPTLRPLIHFIKYRVKERESLANKLERFALEGKPRAIDEANLFESVLDLAGVRIVHLHADQVADIHTRILEILKEEEYQLIGDPVAYCWDDDYEALFKRIGLLVRRRSSMYMTVHYDVLVRASSGISCELQVRSLADEVWGEVSHRVNYPVESPSEACRDQLKVLARLTSGCGRLVDSIFKTHGGAAREQS